MSDFMDISGTVTVGKKTYAVGLLWNTASGVGKAAKAEARAAAKMKTINADFYCVRGSATPQYGLGSKEDGHKVGMPSLAALLAEARNESWLGVFKVPEGYYFVAVRDEGILSECDKLYSDEDDARSKFAEILYASEWPKAYAPEDWGFEEAEESSLEDLIGGAKPKAKLAMVDNSRERNVLVLGGGLVAIAFGVLYFGKDMIFQEEAPSLVDQFTPPPLQTAEPEKPPFIPPWRGKAMPSSFVESCLSVVDQPPLDVPGWLFDGVTCNETNAVAAYKRAGGTVNWIQNAVKPAVAIADGENASVSYQYPGPMEPRADESTVGVRQGVEYLKSFFEEVFVEFRSQQGDSAPEFVSVNYGFKTAEHPKNFVKALDSVPALTVSKVTLNLSAGEWIIEGKIYERLPDPIPVQPQ